MRSAIGAVIVSLFGLSCSDAASTEFGDLSPPTVTLVPGSGQDTTLVFSAEVRDNLGIKRVVVNVTGGVTASFDTTFTSAVTQTVIPYRVGVSRSVPPGTGVIITAQAFDGAGNESAIASLVLGVGNLAPSVVVLTSPSAGTIAVIGKSLVLSVSATSPVGVRSAGFFTTGVLTTADSSIFSSPLLDSVSVTDTLTIPGDVLPGQLILTPFLRDSLGQRHLGPAVPIAVQSAATTSAVPVVSFGLNSRTEVNDTIHVTATDPTGITTMGYEVRSVPDGAIEARDSVISNGDITTLTHTFTMSLPYTLFPTTIYVKAFAMNSNGVRAYARLASGVDRVDTVTVVAGATKPLPFGGVIADAYYHPNTDRLYLTNIERNRLEVFAMADTSFQPSISTGSRPWGITAWPADHSGAVTDRLLVANSGGTSISYVNVGSGSALSPSGFVESTYALPNIVVYSVTTVASSTAPGVNIAERTKYDFSDRPQFVAATCRGAAPGPCGDVILVYSTTPTGGQSRPFPNMGTIRWENLTNQTSHFFFEQAMGQTQGRSDTLEIERLAAAGFGSDAMLVRQHNPLSGGGFASIVVDLPKLTFRDTTFVRNSGDFRRVIIGEGGSVLGSRALMYDAQVGPTTSAQINGATVNFTDPIIDPGVSRASDVSDFIGNSFARVRGAAINFDGELAAIRGDSTYVLDRTLRLQGLFQTSGGNPGFDFHPFNKGNGTDVSRTDCLSFAASTEPVIEVYENKFYSRVAAVPVRDPIIGPIKAALRGLGGIVLVGATQRGIVVVNLSTSQLPGCSD
ncbi:MAG TPA: hypothetical protein VMM17_08490 [Gemmatimonadaceae bacterium]|nr:hypothetical protein [Gemmatimonadaceae bacterium]